METAPASSNIFDYFYLGETAMQAVAISGENNSDIKLLLELAKKLGLRAKNLTKAQLEDWMPVQD